jgi:hypothetical protein
MCDGKEPVIAVSESAATSLPLEGGIGLAAEELAGAGAAYEFASFDYCATVGEDGLRRAFDADALKH